MKDEIKEKNNRICKNCKYHYIEEISFDYPQSCCNKTNPNHTTEKWLNCDNFEYSDDYITNLQEENQRLKELCDKYEEEHSTTFEEWQKAIKENYKLITLNNIRVKEHNHIYNYMKDYKSRIEKANVLLQNILVIRDSEHKGRFRPVKNTSTQDVYKTIIMLNELFETPHRRNYGLLQGEDKDE